LLRLKLHKTRSSVAVVRPLGGLVKYNDDDFNLTVFPKPTPSQVIAMMPPRKKETTSKNAANSVKSQGAAAYVIKLGGKPTVPATKALEIFPSPQRNRDFVVHMQIPEFTCLCPITGQPDFATLYLDYIPEAHCVELKSLKLYIWSFRNEGKFHEAVANEILDSLVAAIAPRFARLTAKFWVRGGIFTTVVAEHRAKGWKPQPAVELGKFADESSVTERN
jgi:7-cyano-7-deazaguanine reductase